MEFAAAEKTNGLKFSLSITGSIALHAVATEINQRPSCFGSVFHFESCYKFDERCSSASLRPAYDVTPAALRAPGKSSTFSQPGSRLSKCS